MFMSINTGTPLSVAVPLLAVVVLGALSFALGTRAASGTPSRLIAGSPLDSCGDGMDNRENSGTPSAATKSEGIRGSKSHDNTESTRPTAIATWRFGSVAVAAAKISLESGGTALDALEAGDKGYISILNPRATRCTTSVATDQRRTPTVLRKC